MQLGEKQELVRLLNLYKQEKINDMECNISNINTAKKAGKPKWEADVIYGLKAQYNHARIISQKLENEISKEMPSYWQM